MKGIGFALCEQFTICRVTDRLTFSFFTDYIGIIFAALTVILWIAAGIYSIDYLKEDRHKKRFFVFFVLLGVSLLLMSFASNLFTFYLCYELVTLLSFPLVLHDGTKESVKAGIKYLIYSFTGAYLALLGFFLLNPCLETLSFAKTADFTGKLITVTGTKEELAVFLMILGFGVKAGMWPMHSWLPTAHPVAPSPASGILSGMIVKAGVLGIIRVLFFMGGAEVIRESTLRFVWIALVLITVLLGSLKAFREPVLKKRLAYSTVSQAAYILFGLSMLGPAAYEGAVLQMMAHAFAKCALFLIAGALIHATGRKNADDFPGIGKKYPLLMSCFILCSLSLIGIPPTGGFVAKWFLGVGALEAAEVGFATWFGPVVLLISALLTAGYLLPMGVKAFMPGRDEKDEFADCGSISLLMQLPILVLTVLSVALGVIAYF